MMFFSFIAFSLNFDFANFNAFSHFANYTLGNLMLEKIFERSIIHFDLKLKYYKLQFLQMKTNERKQKLLYNKLDKYIDEDQRSEWLEMENFKASNNKGVNYIKLQDQENNAGRFFTNNPYNNQVQYHNTEKAFVNKPLVPNASYNSEPNKIVMNGLTFVRKDQIRGSVKTQTKPKKPEMHVICERCYTNQMVPANAHAFICYSCDCTQKCLPQFGIFICGSCQRQVWYPEATSSLIKCTKCGTINKIPQAVSGPVQVLPNPFNQISGSNASFDEIISVKNEEEIHANKYPQL